MNSINFFYTGTKTVDFSIEVKKVSGGIEVTSSQLCLDKEFFNESSAEEFLSEHKEAYDLNQDYEIV